MDYNIISSIIGYTYKNTELLTQAFTHSSYANENNTADYERLEFLGDSILESLTTLFLYKNFNEAEGDLSKLRAKIVSAPSLNKTIHDLGLIQYIRVGGSIGKNIPSNIVADVFESIVASIFLDGGLNEANKFVVNKLLISKAHILEISKEFIDHKTLLQEKLQAVGKHAIYKAEEINQDNIISFNVCLLVDNKVVATATATSKKLGEQACAKKILEDNGGTL